MAIRGNRLRQLRQARGLSVRQLSRETGIRAPTLYALEAGRRVNIGIDALARLAIFFGVTSDYLLDIDPGNQRDKDAGAAVAYAVGS